MNSCPDCSKTLAPNATRCRCGWVANTARSTYIECAFAGCPQSATLNVKTPTGRANVCPAHDLAIVQKRAEKYCAELGLDTLEKRRAWVLSRKRVMRRFDEVVREPEEEAIPF